MRTGSEGIRLIAALLAWLSLDVAYGGTIGVKPAFDTGTEIRDAVKLRYHMRVNDLTAETLKIIFQTRRLYNPSCTGSNCQTYLLESNLYSYWVQYADTGCVSSPPSNAGTSHFGQAGLWLSIPDYNQHGLVGSRPANDATKQMFPRVMTGIDNIPGLTKIETVSQKDVAGQDVTIEYARGTTFTAPLSGWGSRFDPAAPRPNIGQPPCAADLPSGVVYRTWTSTVTIGTQTYSYDFAVPDAYATHLAPDEILSIVTEFLEKTPNELSAGKGNFQVYFWDFEVQRENSNDWLPLNKLQVFYRADPTANLGWGAKIGTYMNRAVLEMSNDTTDTYLQLSDVFQLPISPRMYLRGSFNGWGALPMAWDAKTGAWVAKVRLAANAQLKFDARGDWSRNWGDNNPNDGKFVAESGGNNITIASAGEYVVSFNDQTSIYSAKLQAPPFQRTVVFMRGETVVGQDMFLRGGIDWGYARNSLGKDCSVDKWLCAIPIQHNLAKADANRIGDKYLDWYGAEAGQASGIQGSPLVWTTNSWPPSWGDKKTVASDDYGEDPENKWGAHYWKLDVMMDCSRTVEGWFELKSFISNGPGWEDNISQANSPYKSNNHFAKCGMLNKFERGSNAVLIEQLR